jgi:hypothetical protein
MENKDTEKRKSILLGILTPKQKEYFEAVDWLFNGPRASGRTQLIVVIALIGLLNGGHEGHIIDHHAMSHEGTRSYLKSMIYSLANEIQLAIEIKETRSGFIIRKSTEFVQYEYGLRKSKNE